MIRCRCLIIQIKFQKIRFLIFYCSALFFLAYFQCLVIFVHFLSADYTNSSLSEFINLYHINTPFRRGRVNCLNCELSKFTGILHYISETCNVWAIHLFKCVCLKFYHYPLFSFDVVESTKHRKTIEEDQRYNSQLVAWR